jgi:hypothetical protein
MAAAGPLTTKFRVPQGSRTLLASTALTLVAFTGSPRLQAQQPLYRFVDVRTMVGPCCTDEGMAIVVDGEGGVLVAGRRGSLDLDHDGAIDVKTWGSPDSLVSKVVLNGKDNTGWTLDLGGPGDDRAHGIAPDGRGGAYVVGEFPQSLHAGNLTLQSRGLHDGFLVRYDRRGRPLWAKAIGGDGRDVLNGVAADKSGNVFVIGIVKGAVDVDRDGTVDVNANADGTAVIASFSPDGTFRWARFSHGPSRVGGQAIAIGPDDAIYIAGYYEKGTPDFDGDGRPDGAIAAAVPATSPPALSINAYYARLDANGRIQWMKAVSGEGLQMASSLAVAGNGDLLVVGGFSATADTDGDGAGDLTFTSMGNRKGRNQLDANSFLLRVSPDGARIWARRFMASAGHVTAAATRIAISGTYGGDLDLDGDGRLDRSADPDEGLEGFVAILDEGGEVRQTLTVVGGDSDIVNAAAFTADGRYLYYTGYTRLGADYDGDGVIETASVCHLLGDIYLAVFSALD